MDVLETAVEAQRGWRRVPVEERTAICLRMKDWMVVRADEIGAEISREMGRPIAWSPNEIRRGFAERAEHMAAIASACLTDVPTDPKEDFTRFIRREPVGVVLVLAPWRVPS